jgi:hypothetical protein
VSSQDELVGWSEKYRIKSCFKLETHEQVGISEWNALLCIAIILAGKMRQLLGKY